MNEEGFDYNGATQKSGQVEVNMDEAEKLWRAKADDELLAAARRLAEYTEEGSGMIRAELRRRGLDEPPSIIRHADAGGKAQMSISDRYTDAYVVANAIITTGTIVKVVGVVLAAVTVLVVLVLTSSVGAGNFTFWSIGGLLLGALVGLIFWIAGVFVTAQGQLLRALLDTAVNTSPLVSNTEKERIMGIT
jgi:hypothetical protein